MEPSQEKKISRSPVIIVLIILVLALAGVIAYLYLKPISTGTKTVGGTPKGTTQTETQGGTQTGTQPGTTGITPTTGTTTPVKADIDKDVQSLDSLNLSGAENDYGEENLNDL